MSQLSYANYENRIRAKEEQARKAARDSFKPFMACHDVLAVQSIVYRPTKAGKPRWIGQAMPMSHMVDDLPITFWQEHIDFINAVTGLNIGIEPIEIKPFDVITDRCHPHFGLHSPSLVRSPYTGKFVHMNDIDSQSKAIVVVTEPPEPTPTPVAQAQPEKRGYLHLRDLLRKNGHIGLSFGDPLAAKAKRLAELGFCEGGKHNQWTATNKVQAKSATVAPVVIEKPKKNAKSVNGIVVPEYVAPSYVQAIDKRRKTPTQVVGNCRVLKKGRATQQFYNILEVRGDYYILQCPVLFTEIGKLKTLCHDVTLFDKSKTIKAVA